MFLSLNAITAFSLNAFTAFSLNAFTAFSFPLNPDGRLALDGHRWRFWSLKCKRFGGYN